MTSLYYNGVVAQSKILPSCYSTAPSCYSTAPSCYSTAPSSYSTAPTIISYDNFGLNENTTISAIVGGIRIIIIIDIICTDIYALFPVIAVLYMY